MSRRTPPTNLEPIERASRDEISALQLERMKWSLRHAYDNVPHYRKKFDAKGVHPDDLKSLADLAKFPFSTKTDLRDNYPFGLFAVPREKVARIHASSGTTGKPTVVGYTRRDIDHWAELVARSLAAAGMHPGERLQVGFGYGLFTGGLGLHYGGEKLGVMVVPMSGGQTHKQIMLMEDFAVHGLCCTPSYALNIAEEAEKLGVDIRKLPLRVGIFGAEPWSEEMRYEIEARLGINAIDIYGLSEVMGPGVSIECDVARKGLHVWEDHFLVECVDQDSGLPLPYGEEGELVFTSLTKEAFPILRYRTRDISVLSAEPCKCGRTHVRMNRVTGRSDDMLIIRGVNVFPSQVESILMRTETLSPFYQIEVFREGHHDVLVVNVEASPPLLVQGEEAMTRVRHKVEKDIKDFIGISATVNLKQRGEIERSQGKAVRVVDHRKK